MKLKKGAVGQTKRFLYNEITVGEWGQHNTSVFTALFYMDSS